MGIVRTQVRWATVGALAALSIGTVGVVRAEPPAGEANVFVPVVPCRLLDTRPAPDTVGPRSTPLAAGETIVQQVTGANGNCAIPTDASGVAMNVTAVGGTAPSFLTVWPSDAAERPVTSNLNWLPAAPPTPNKVDVGLAADGTVSIYNRAGRVDVIADVVGYFTVHTHDDRYYTRDEIDAQAFISTVVTVTESGSIPPGGTNGSAFATCPAGTTVTGGGVGSGDVALRIYTSIPSGNGWFGVVKPFDNQPMAGGAGFTVYALCAS